MPYSYQVLSAADQAQLLTQKRLELEKSHYLANKALVHAQAQPVTPERQVEVSRLSKELEALEKALAAL